MTMKHNGILIKGILHWLKDEHEILSFDTENEKSCIMSIRDLPKEYTISTESCVGKSNGQLHCVIFTEFVLKVWYLEDYVEFKRKLKYPKPMWELGEED